MSVSDHEYPQAPGPAESSTVPPARLTEDQAAWLWQRAAEMQARALHQLESREPALTEGASEADPDPFADDGFALEDVRRAAEEAGIHPDFVERALVQLRNESREMAGPTGPMDLWADRLLGGPNGSMTARRTLRGKGDAVLAALDRVLTGPGYDLSLEDMSGDDPLNGATLSFRVGGFSGASTDEFAWRAAWLWAQTLLVTVRPAPGRGPDDDEAWEVELTVPLRKGRRANAWGSLFTAGFAGLPGGAVGAAAGFGIGTALALPAALAGAVIVAGAAVGLGGSGWGGAAFYRLGWRHGATEMARTLDDTLRKVALHLRTGGAFSLPSRRPGGDAAAEAVLLPLGILPDQKGGRR